MNAAQRLCDLRVAALAEVVPFRVSFTPDASNPEVHRSHQLEAIDRVQPGYRLRSMYLAVMAVHGKDHDVYCPDHFTVSLAPDRPACRKVSVVSALLGRTCGAP